MDNKELIETAIKISESAYCPYSAFHVGAALLCGSGKVYTGVNVENASYGAGICAERSATVQAVTNGEREFVKIAIFGKAENSDELQYAFPCGICRQFLNEFAIKGMKVLVAKSVDDYIETTLQDLLPSSFGPENLK